MKNILQTTNEDKLKFVREKINQDDLWFNHSLVVQLLLESKSNHELSNGLVHLIANLLSQNQFCQARCTDEFREKYIIRQPQELKNISIDTVLCPDGIDLKQLISLLSANQILNSSVPSRRVERLDPFNQNVKNEYFQQPLFSGVQSRFLITEQNPLGLNYFPYHFVISGQKPKLELINELYQIVTQDGSINTRDTMYVLIIIQNEDQDHKQDLFALTKSLVDELQIGYSKPFSIGHIQPEAYYSQAQEYSFLEL
jgi:hypothetical protein